MGTTEGSKGKCCVGCREWKPTSEFYPRSEGQGTHNRCRACYAAYAKEWWRRKKEALESDPEGRRAALRAAEALKEEMFTAYGGRCACCGERVALFLRIERVRREEAPSNESNERTLWRKLKGAGWPDTHELVCANCSLGKLVNGVCPHRERGTG